MITLESIRNTKNHNYLIEEIRKKMTTLEQAHWKIEISWVKAHIGIIVNELADRFAKTAANDNDTKIIVGREKDRQNQWRTEGVVWGVQTPPHPRNSEDIGEVLDRVSKKNRRLDFLL